MATGVPTGLILKFVLTAASRLPTSQIPPAVKQQLCSAGLNMTLENAMNEALMAAREFYENCGDGLRHKTGEFEPAGGQTVRSMSCGRLASFARSISRK